MGRFHFKLNFGQTEGNGAEISSQQSFQKFRKLLNFRNANHSTERNSGNSGSKVEWKEHNRKFGYTSRGCPLFWKFWKMLFHSLQEAAENSKRTFWVNGKCPMSLASELFERRTKKLLYLVVKEKLGNSSLRGRRLEVLGARKKRRASPSPLACLPRARPFSLAPTTSKPPAKQATQIREVMLVNET